MGTNRSPEGQPVPIEWVQTAVDRLIEERELEINPKSVNYGSAFIGAVLLTLPGVEGDTNPRRVRLVDFSPVTAAPMTDTAAPMTSVSPERPSPAPDALGRALAALESSPTTVGLNYYDRLEDIDRPGLYSWWVDETGADHLSEGLEMALSSGRIYVGQAGATQWPSGKKRDATMRDRISLMHLGHKITFSTLRLTLAVCLRERLSLEVVGAKMLSRESEALLTTWMKEHLEIAAFGYVDVDSLDELEQQVLRALDPPLNLKHMVFGCSLVEVSSVTRPSQSGRRRRSRARRSRRS